MNKNHLFTALLSPNQDLPIQEFMIYLFNKEWCYSLPLLAHLHLEEEKIIHTLKVRKCLITIFKFPLHTYKYVSISIDHKKILPYQRVH